MNIYNKVIEDKKVSGDNIKYSENVLKNFEEIYYTTQSNYENILNKDIKKFYAFIFAIVIDVVLILKIIFVFSIKRGKIVIRGNIIKDIIYIFKHVFKYRGTRRVMIATIILSIIFYIAYLYLLALGGDKNNILVNFLYHIHLREAYL